MVEHGTDGNFTAAGGSVSFLDEVVELILPPPAAAQTNLVNDGTFQITSGTSLSFEFGTPGWPGNPPGQVGSPASAGFAFVFVPGSTVATAANGGTVSLWSPTTGREDRILQTCHKSHWRPDRENPVAPVLCVTLLITRPYAL